MASPVERDRLHALGERVLTARGGVDRLEVVVVGLVVDVVELLGADADPVAACEVVRAELDRTGTVVVYGDGNVDPTSTWLTLKAIGFEDVRLYDGGFGEWANVESDRGRYPVETATNVVVETEGSVGGDDDGGDFSCTG